MGNRAVITTSTNRTKGIGIYLHWNGGPESVLAFLHAAKERGFRDPAGDGSYAMARLCGLIHEFFGVNTDTSLGLGELKSLDTNNWDNGTYVIGKGWEIVERWGDGSSAEKTVDELSAEQLKKYTEIKEHLVKLGKEAELKEAA